MSVPRDAQTFGSLLRTYRRDARLTQEALAERSGVSTRAIQHLEASGVRPRHATALQLIDALRLQGPDRQALEGLAAPSGVGSAQSPRRQPEGDRRRSESRTVFALPLPQPAEADRPRPFVALPRRALTNLPQPPNALIGRERDVEEVGRLLLGDDTRLVTLTGVGGSGKTRLALAVAATVASDFPLGVWLVELAPVSDPALVVMALATALGVRETGGVSVLDAVLAFLSQRSALLVLDNCEHLIDASAELAERLLATCANLRILATSREPLQLASERRYRLQSLAVPHIDGPAGIVELARSPAVRLFLARSQAVEADFALTADNAEAIRQICTRLAGIPLALELAAARVGVLSVEQIRDRLDDGFRLLVGSSRTAPTRQRTLRATLDWSHDLLADAERAAFRRLAVFAGGCDLEAVEAVCGDPSAGPSRAGISFDSRARSGPTPTSGQAVLDVLGGLVNKSLVLTDKTTNSTRYRLLEPVRQYARQQLDTSGESEAARARHATYYTAVAERADPELRGPEQLAWLVRLDSEQDNLRAALAWGLADEGKHHPVRAELGARLVGALHFYWHTRCHFTEGRRWGEAAQGMLDELPAGIHGRASVSLALLLQPPGEYARAEALLAEAEALLREAGDRWWIGWSLALHGLCTFYEAAYERAAALFEEGLHEFQAQDDTWGIGWSLACLGRVAMARGEQTRAAQLFEASVRVQRQVGNPMALALSLVFRGRAALARGNYAGATADSEEGLRLFRSVGTPRGIGYALTNLGQVVRAQGDRVRSLMLLAEALALHAEQGDRGRIAELLDAMAGTSVLAGSHGPPHEAPARDELVRAARLMGAAEGLREMIRAPLRPGERLDYDRDTAFVRAQLGGSMFEAAWADGRAMPLERAIEQAIALAPQPS